MLSCNLFDHIIQWFLDSCISVDAFFRDQTVCLVVVEPFVALVPPKHVDLRSVGFLLELVEYGCEFQEGVKFGVCECLCLIGRAVSETCIRIPSDL